MGRAFELRKARKEKRWGRMAVQFTRLGKEISMAVKQAGPDVDANARLRAVVQNAKNVNMPKDRIEAAIKRAVSKEDKDYQEMVYEGYGPHGIAILIETATENPNRTIANLRSYFTRLGGAIGKTGALDFIFERKGVFKIATNDLDTEMLELELIDHGADETELSEDGFYVYTPFSSFGTMQHVLEDKKIEVISAEAQRFAGTLTTLSADQQKDVLALIERIEEDEDVQAVYHNMEESE